MDIYIQSLKVNCSSLYHTVALLLFVSVKEGLNFKHPFQCNKLSHRQLQTSLITQEITHGNIG